MKKQNKPFFVDPYPYKPSIENISQDDSIFLQKLFGKNENEVFTASMSFRNNSDGLRSFIFVSRSYENLRQNELSVRATSLAMAIIIFAIEGIMSSYKKKKMTRLSEPEMRLITYLRTFMTRDEKLLLLNSFVFSSKASRSIPMSNSTLRHVMYRGMLRECISDEFESYEEAWCSTQESTDNNYCNCIKWLSTQNDKKINRYLKQLSRHLYRMRCSIVHDGVAPLISHAEERPKNVAIWGMTVADMYLDNKRSRHFHYNSSISRKKMEEIFISSLWRAFLLGYPKKLNKIT